MKTPHILQAVIGSERDERSQTYTELDMALTQNSTNTLQSTAAINLLAYRTRRRRNVNIPGAKVHRQSSLKPPNCFLSTAHISANASSRLCWSQRGPGFRLPWATDSSLLTLA